MCTTKYIQFFILISTSILGNAFSDGKRSLRMSRNIQSDILPPPPPPPPQPVEPKGVKGTKSQKEKKYKAPPPLCETDTPCPPKPSPAPCPENTVCPTPPPPHGCCHPIPPHINNIPNNIDETSSDSGDGESSTEITNNIDETSSDSGDGESSTESVQENVLQFEMPEDPILYTGEHKIENADLLNNVIKCVTECTSDCGMYSYNNVFFDGVLDVDFSCIESCMDGKSMSCSNIATCQLKC